MMTTMTATAEGDAGSTGWIRALGLDGWLPLLSSLVCFDVVLFGLTRTNPDAVGGIGLAGVLSPWYYVGLAGIVATLAVTTLGRGRAPYAMPAQVVVLVIALTATSSLVEPLPRFATAWVHAGFAEYIGRTGHILAGNDARFSWPGFFASAGVFAKAVGVPPLALLRWTPVLLNLLCLLPLSVIARAFISDSRQRVLALAIFVTGNWVGQDYFAPQSVNFLLYLVLVALLFSGLTAGQAEGRPARFAGRVLGRRGDGTHVDVAQLPAGQRVCSLIAVITLYAASVVSHQLTQFFMLFAVATLVVLGVCKLRWLPVLFACMTAAYIVWGAQDFWYGHLDELTRGIGAIGTSVHENVTQRVSRETTPARDWVLRTRLLLTAAMWLLAVVGLRRCRDRRLMVVAALAVVPFLVLGLQSYGGEVLLRVHLFSMPFVAILASYAGSRSATDAARGDESRSWRVPAVAAVMGVALAVAFLVARFGNEQFERMQAGDVRAVRALYEVAPRGSVIYVLAESVPWRDQHMDDYDYRFGTPLPLTTADLAALVSTMRAESEPSYLVVTESQWAEMQLLAALSEDRTAAAQKLVRESPLLTRVYGTGDVGVYTVAGS
jgi:hypothetical protein